jgi:aryl-alcohol dehydrogenase-like predicted oxidoreductase
VFVERSCAISTDAIDLLQLHCPPSEVVRECPRCSGSSTISSAGSSILWRQRRAWTTRFATDYPNAVGQIIFNMFRLKPPSRSFPIAQSRQVGVIARVLLASGLLTGKLGSDRQFAGRSSSLQSERRVVRCRRDV